MFAKITAQVSSQSDENWFIFLFPKSKSKRNKFNANGTLMNSAVLFKSQVSGWFGANYIFFSNLLDSTAYQSYSPCQTKYKLSQHNCYQPENMILTSFKSVDVIGRYAINFIEFYLSKSLLSCWGGVTQYSTHLLSEAVQRKFGWSY